MRSNAGKVWLASRAVLPERLGSLWRQFRLWDAVLLSSLPLFVATLLIGDGINRYVQSIQFDDWWTARASVRGYVGSRARTIATLPTRVRLRQSFDPNAPDSGILRISVPRRRWDLIQADPLSGWDEWVDAVVSYGDTSLDARLRKRGDNSLHWLTEKRSLTVRTSRNELYKGYREFGLSGKDVLSSYLANRLAREFGLLAPDTRVVAVYLNNQFYGMFRFSRGGG